MVYAGGKIKQITLWLLIVSTVWQGQLMGQSMRIQVYGHRGAAGIAPENSLVAFKTGLSYGVDALDMDVVLTQDNVVVVAHDPVLHSQWTYNGRIGWFFAKKTVVKEVPFKTLQAVTISNELLNRHRAKIYQADSSYTKNQTIHSLEFVLRFIEQHRQRPMKYQIELKSGPDKKEQYPEYHALVKATVQVIQKLNLTDSVELQSFDWRALLLAKKLAPNIKRSFITERAVTFSKHNLQASAEHSWTAGYQLKDYNDSIPQLLVHLGADIWCPKFSDLSAAQIKEAHQLGLKVVPWTLDSNKALQKAIAFKVDGIITNRPDKLQALLNKNS